MSKRTDSSGLGSLGSGALTGASLLVVAAASAATGIVIAREFGRGAETDGLLAAYGVFTVVVVAAQAVRVAVLPRLARAASSGTLAGELTGYAIALAAVAVPLVLLATLWSDALGGLLTGDESEVAQETAATALVWMVPAGAMHLFAGLAASGLAALDDYGTAAVGYAAGGIAGLTLIVLRADADGIVAVAWGSALNGAVALAVPLVGLGLHALRSRMPAGAVRPSGESVRARFGAFAVGAALPIALQLLYVVCLPFAAGLGTGSATSFVYGYLAAASLVTVTAGSLGLVTAVPLTRADFGAREAARHVVASSWLALVLVAAAAGAFAVAGGSIVRSVLGGAYAGDAGTDVGWLVVALSPWIVVSVGVAVAFPLAFVAGRTRRLPWIALAALVLQVPLAWLGVRAFELYGLAAALLVSTLAVLVALLVELEAHEVALRGVALAALTIGAVAAVSFAPPALLVGALAAAAVGLVAYVVLIGLIRPRPLVESWRYLRALR